MSVVIFANGEIAEKDWALPYLAVATVVIAADGGTHHLLALGRRPDVVIGDLDSLTTAMKAELATAGTEFVTYPMAKDETDLELALRYACDHYDDEILLFATLGGRLDQTLANILLLAHPALRGRAIYIVEKGQRAWLVDEETEIKGKIGELVSLVPLGGDVHVAETTGLLWPLRDEVLAFGPARGVSNVMTAGVAHLRIQSGRLLCIHLQQV